MIFLFGLNLEERGWEERPSVQLYISYSKIAIYLSLVDLSQVAGLQPPQVSQHIHVSCATHAEKTSDRGVSCISKIKGLLNLLNLLSAQLRRISKLSTFFSLKFVVC